MFSKTFRGAFFALFICLALAAPRVIGQQPPNQPAAPALDAAQKQAIVDEISKLLNENYIFPETAKKLEEALRGKLAAGELDPLKDARAFAQAVSKLLVDVGRDRHMGFAYAPGMAEDVRKMMGQSEEEKAKVRERRLRESRRDNFGFRKVEQLPGNIGYLDFRIFDLPRPAGARRRSPR